MFKLAPAIAFILALFLGQLPVTAQVVKDSELQSNATTQETSRIEELRLIATKGDAAAQFELGQAYADGRILKQDSRKALKWISASANQGFAPAQVNLGMLYYVGAGVSRDYAKARYWTQKAAEQGNPKAEQNMGVLYASGQGVEKDVHQSVLWFQRAAEHGHPVGAYNVGVAYAKGIGVPKDETKGYMWLYIAGTKFGYAPSNRELNSLKDRVGKKIESDALRSAEQWIKTHPNVKPFPY